MDALIADLKQDEGFRAEVYLDSEGLLTCGWGHYLRVGSRVPLEACEAFFKQDLADAVSSFRTIPPIYRRRLNPARARVITNMIFNMGIARTMGFHRMWACIEAGDFEGAAENILWNDKENGIKTPYYITVKGRAERLAEIFRRGEEVKNNE